MPALSRSASIARWASALLVVGSFVGCKSSQDDARVQQLLNQRGFGGRFSGDINEQYYLGVGDVISVVSTDFPEGSGPHQVRSDGVIDVPLIGEIPVAGLTIPDVTELLTRRFQDYVKTARADVQLQGNNSKVFYVEGEVQAVGIRPFFGDRSLFRVVFDARPTILADEDDVRLIRSDPLNPLVVHFDYDDHVVGGWSGGNVEVRENDIVYVPPNTLGYISLALEGLLAPLQRAFLGVLQASRLVSLTETFGDARGNRFGRGGRGGRFGGFGFGGFHDDGSLLPAELDRPLGLVRTAAPESAGRADGR